MPAEIEVSVLCPTRRRPELLRRSYDSLISLADDPWKVELLTAVDKDDHGTAESSETWQPYDIDQSVWWTAPERYGYSRLHEYYNALARRARGRWCVLWNDDAVMLTQGWDTVIAAQQPRALWLQANHHCTGNLFPAWPSAWSDAMGHVSLSPNVDRWISEIARMKNLEQPVDIRVQHDRADITGANRDQTYLEGRHLMGDADDSQFYSNENIAARCRDAQIIEELVYGNPS